MSDSAITEEFLACWHVIMTTRSEDLFEATLARARELLPQVDPATLLPDECDRLVLDAAVVSLDWEWGPFDSRDESVAYIAHHCRGHEAAGFMMPEFYNAMRRSS